VLMAGNGHALPADKPMSGDEAAQRFYIIHGDNDTIVPVAPDRAYVGHLRQAAFPTVYREIAGDPHVLSWLPHQIITPDAFAWMEAQRNRAIPLDAQEQQVVQSLGTAIEAGKRNVATDFAKIDRLAGQDVDALVIKATESAVPAIRTAAAKYANRRLLGKTAAKALLRLVDDRDAGVRKEAIPAVGQLALWQDDEAVALLIARATDPKRSGDMRQACIAQIARAWRINLPCSNQDKQISETWPKLGRETGGLGKLVQMGRDGLIGWSDGVVVVLPPWKPK